MITNPQINDWLAATIQKRGMKGNDGSTEQVAGYVVAICAELVYFRVNEKVRIVNLSNPTLQVLPPKPSDDAILVNIFGTFEWFNFLGNGAYPYDCKAKDKAPNAGIYQNNKGGWIIDNQLLKTKNGYYNYR